MKTVTISAHSLRVKNHRDEEYYNLSKLPNRHTLLGLLEQYLNKLKDQAPSEDVNHVLLTTSNVQKTTRSISACLERGEYGVVSKLLDVRKRVVAYERSVNEAEMMPFFFLAAIPAHAKMGVAAFQMESNAGVRTRFKIEFEDFLRSQCGDVDFEIETIVPKRLIQNFVKKQRVTKLRFVNLKTPRSIAQAFQGNNIGKNTTIELQVKVKHGANLLLAEGIKDIVKGSKPVSEFVQLRGFEYDTVKAEFEVGGKHRTIDFTNHGSFHADYDITKNAQGPNGYPTFDSIYPPARDIVIEIMKSLKLDTSGV